jgi:hypothetical protein
VTAPSGKVKVVLVLVPAICGCGPVSLIGVK